jgi:hypothetical protein
VALARLRLRAPAGWVEELAARLGASEAAAPPPPPGARDGRGGERDGWGAERGQGQEDARAAWALGRLARLAAEEEEGGAPAEEEAAALAP